MGSFWKVLFIIGLQLFAVPGYAQQIDIGLLQYWNTPDQTQMLFDVTSSPEHRVFLMKNPARLVIDMRNANVKQALSQPPASHPLFSHVRYATRNTTDVRIVVDLKQEISAKNMSLMTNSRNGHRLVIELLNKRAKKSEETVIKTAAVKTTNTKQHLAKAVNKPQEIATNKVESSSVKSTKTSGRRDKNVVIAIDAGHGGNDPGAHGNNGTEEKKITLAIAKKLAYLINKQPGMKAVMVRKGDYYVGLRERMQIARTAKADLFISIHADAFENATVKGASVYTLSTKGATSEAARWLANSENASDLVGGVSLSDKEDVLASVLLDLSQTATEDASVKIAGKVLKNFERIGELHYKAVQKAGFAVLKSPDIPSILIETAFISNPSEELKLVNTTHQSNIALAIFDGVRSHFNNTTPVESKVAALDM
ncbi:MAG: N-acetylmuramoyl-L-alanine amidase [Methylobacter sp.]|nr:N-acetylmuramoyl-L-alanine amidase [Methylobacter sp.]